MQKSESLEEEIRSLTEALGVTNEQFAPKYLPWLAKDVKRLKMF